MNRLRATVIVIIILSLLTFSGVIAYQAFVKQPEPTTYEECIAQNGNQSPAIFPGTCTTKSGKQFTQSLTPEEQEMVKPPQTNQ